MLSCFVIEVFSIMVNYLCYCEEKKMNNHLNVFQQILAQGVENNASDWHIKEGTGITLRIAGKLVPLDFIPSHDFMEGVIDSIITPEQKQIYTDTGDMDVSFAMEEIGRFRINIHKQRALHAMTIRYVKSKILSVNELSLPPVLDKIAEEKRGIIIICGTTGSGKSTTLAAMLQHVNLKSTMHVITIEDPIEYEFRDELSVFEQREVGLDTVSFESALSHALRQDPDIIMIGEMRDATSFETALQAADTGHLVLTTLHATNAPQAINRILEFYPKAKQDTIRETLAVNLRAIIAQKLLPKALGNGVIPVCEIMLNTPVIEKHIRHNELDKLDSIIKTSKSDGMISFNASIFQKINNGDITEETGLEASAEPEALRMRLKGIVVNDI